MPTTSRDANRFFARLGFSSVIMRRIVSTGQLRRKLAPESIETGHELLRRRRSLRSRAFRPPHARLTAGPSATRLQAPGAASRIRQVIRLVQTRLPSSSVTTTS